MLEIQTELDIEASAEEVWTVLTDFPAYAAWNPFIRAIAGRLEPGARLDIRIEPAGGRAMKIAPSVLVADRPRELRWKGRMLLSLLFEGEHRFVIERVAGERVRFQHGEKFRGILVLLFRRRLESGIRESFQRMNTALKQRAEEHAQAMRKARTAAAASGECTLTKVAGADGQGRPIFGDRSQEPCTVVTLPGDGADVLARIGSAPEYPATPGGKPDAVLMLGHTTRTAVGDLIEVAGWKLKVSGMSPGFDSIGKRVWTVVETVVWQ